MIRLLLAEDQLLLRTALASLLAMEGDIEVADQAGDGVTALRLLRELRPDIALLDIDMPGLSGLDVLKACTAERLPTQILVLTTYARPGYIRAAIDAGARGFMIKDRPVPELAEAIRRIIAGEMVIDPNLAVSALGIAANPLSEREREILRASAGGLTIRAIAGELFLSASTVRNYLSQAIQKTGAQTRAEAYATALNNGWI
ncbi:MAG TPA: response regulator transcription factor [Streptosporangiaceae bacterium]|nr:response regulator transcription factor [Streptosporangiaceae bacterium]